MNNKVFYITGLALLVPAPAAAEDVSLSGTLLQECTLTLDTAGSLATSEDGTVLGSEEAGGIGATLALVAVGATPTLTFAAPTLDAPAGDSGSTVEVAYSSTGGASQDYTDQQTTSSESVLIDVYTVHGKATNASGFAAGTYTITTVVTCAQ